MADALNLPGSIKIAVVSSLNAGTTVIITGVTGVRTRILSITLVAAAAATVQIQETDATPWSGVMTLAVGIPLVLPFTGIPWVETDASGEGIQLVITGTTPAVSGFVHYS